MPGSVRKDGVAKRIALNILGPPSSGLTDSFGNKKRFVRKRDVQDAEEKYQERIEGEKINYNDQAGFRF